MTKVGKSNGEATFAGTRANGRDATIPAVHRGAGQVASSTRSGQSVQATATAGSAPLRPFTDTTKIGVKAWKATEPALGVARS
jgi:hypothetical protein